MIWYTSDLMEHDEISPAEFEAEEERFCLRGNGKGERASLLALTDEQWVVLPLRKPGVADKVMATTARLSTAQDVLRNEPGAKVIAVENVREVRWIPRLEQIEITYVKPNSKVRWPVLMACGHDEDAGSLLAAAARRLDRPIEEKPAPLIAALFGPLLALLASLGVGGLLIWLSTRAYEGYQPTGDLRGLMWLGNNLLVVLGTLGTTDVVLALNLACVVWLVRRIRQPLSSQVVSNPEATKERTQPVPAEPA